MIQTPPKRSRELDFKEKMWTLISERLGNRYAGCRLSNFACCDDEKKRIVGLVRDYLADFPGRFRSGQSVLFFGPPGTGKDHLMAAMLHEAVMRGATVKWSDGCTMFGEFRDAMRGTETEGVLLSRLTRPHFLAISDPVPPYGGLTDYQSAMFFRIVDRRYRDKLPTWITINAKDRKEADRLIGASIVDRLGHDALSLPMMWPSYRQK